MRCTECKWNYPDYYMNSMFINGKYTQPICGICALEIQNRLFGVNRTEFQGEMAEQARLNAIEWRKSHPWKKPK